MIALLFDMNELWEEYVLVQLRKTLNSSPLLASKYQVKGQTRKYLWNYNFIQPDIELSTIPKGNEKAIHFIIDTKWKRPGYSASVEDLRQIYTYARFWDASKVMLLYPGNEANLRKGVFKTDDFQLKDGSKTEGEKIEHIGMMGFVSVLDNDNKLDESIGGQILSLLESGKTQ
jgi:5-methylcytosine-specific restriction enzyme subunit McrC